VALFILPVYYVAVNEGDDAGEDLDLELGHKEWRSIDIDPHKLGVVVLLDETLKDKHKEEKDQKPFSAHTHTVLCLLLVVVRRWTYCEVFVDDCAAFEVLVVEVDHDKGRLGGGVEKVLFYQNFRVHAVRIRVHLLKHLRSGRGRRERGGDIIRKQEREKAEGRG